MATNPSWSNAGALALDVAGAAIPFVPATGSIRMAGKLFSHGDDVASGTNAALNVAEGVSDATKVSEKGVEVAKGMNNPKVKESVEIGKKAHAEFKTKVEAKGWKSEPALTDPATGKTVKPDAVTPSGKPVELKPNTPSGVAKGKRQLKAQERATGEKGRVVTYDPEKYRE